jgi:hypothetical protein
MRSRWTGKSMPMRTRGTQQLQRRAGASEGHDRWEDPVHHVIRDRELSRTYRLANH